ncbi:MAG TPA: hypothetical protein VLZ77_14160 [Acidimicrobiales bacterium]|nr:hypothetical protein [Acidimicrobiales bacterium]
MSSSPRLGPADVALPSPVRLLVWALAGGLFFAILLVRGGPNPAETDAHAVTVPATDISHGDLAAAARATLVPNPPGYPLLTAPWVLVFRPWIGSPRWCDDKPVPAILQGPRDAYFRSILMPCSAQASAAHPLPVWYRSQALLTILGWVVLTLGGVSLLRASGRGGGVREAALVVALTVLPASTDAIAQTYHPQDLMSVGLGCVGLAQALRRRWLLCGAAFGAAFLCKQFALLVLIAALAAAPSWPARLKAGGAAVAMAALGIVPFAVVAPVATGHALSAVYVAGVVLVKTPTVIGQLGISEQHKLDIARDAPVVAALVVAGLAGWRRRWALSSPGPLIGLAVACLALRLVFEIALLDYYLLAVGAMLLLLDMSTRTVPVWSVAWIVATRYGLSWLALHGSPPVIAGCYEAAALAGLGLGLAPLVRARLSGTASTAWPAATAPSAWHLGRPGPR